MLGEHEAKTVGRGHGGARDGTAADMGPAVRLRFLSTVHGREKSLGARMCPCGIKAVPRGGARPGRPVTHRPAPLSKRGNHPILTT